MGTAAPNGMNIFPLAMPTTPLVPEFLQDTIVQLLELIAAECAPISGSSQASATFTGLTTFPGSTTISSGGILTTSNAVLTNPAFTSASVTDGTNLALGSGSGTQIGTASSQKLGFFGTTAVTQPSVSGQAAINSASITSSSPYGFTSAIATSVLNLINLLRAGVVATGIVGGP